MGLEQSGGTSSVQIKPSSVLKWLAYIPAIGPPSPRNSEHRLIVVCSAACVLQVVLIIRSSEFPRKHGVELCPTRSIADDCNTDIISGYMLFDLQSKFRVETYRDRITGRHIFINIKYINSLLAVNIFHILMLPLVSILYQYKIICSIILLTRGVPCQHGFMWM